MSKEIKKPRYIECDGLILGRIFSPEAVRSAINYKPKPEDLFIATYPKCGTTWMQHIVTLILRKGKPFKNEVDFFQSNPFLEMTGADAIDAMKRPGAIKIHLPLPLAPFSPKAKYIYVARNPKDCCVSLYYHIRNIPHYDFSDASFDDFFELFIKGEVIYNDYFDHLIPWYKRRNDQNVCFVTFEDLKKDTEGEILKLAKFLGSDYYNDLINDPQYLKDVLYFSSFEYMKNNFKTFIVSLFANTEANSSKDAPVPSGIRHIIEYMAKNPEALKLPANQVRKGKVGDWSNHFTPEQEKRMENYIAEKTEGSDVMSLWKDSN